MAKKVRLLWCGDFCGGTTGFGAVGRNVMKGLHETGEYEVYHLAVGLTPRTLLKHLNAAKKYKEYAAVVEKMQTTEDTWELDYSGLNMPFIDKIIPSKGERFLSGCLQDAVDRFNIDICILNYDPWMTAWTVLYNRISCPIIYYQPIDAISYSGGLPAVRAYGQGGNAIVPWERFMALQDMTVLYGDWSNKLYQDALSKKGMEIFKKFEDTRVIRHGVDIDHYAPMTQKMARSIMGAPQDDFILLSVMANQPRKDWPGVLLVTKKLRDMGIPVRLMPWTNILPHQGNLDIEWAAETMGIRDCVFPPGMTTSNTPENLMPAVYSCADAHLLLSFGEGVGLPHLEATACGVPSLAVDATGTVDYFATDEQKIPANPTSKWQMAQGNALIRPTVDYDVVVDKIATIYRDKAVAKEWAEKARQVIQGWSWKSTIPDWVECINYTYENRKRIMGKKEGVAALIQQEAGSK